jgi:hypothetical protein
MTDPDDKPGPLVNSLASEMAAIAETDLRECPMMLLEVEIARYSGTTYENVAKGLQLAGCIRSATLIGRYDATDAQVKRLEEWLSGDIYLEEETREHTYAELLARTAELERVLAANPEAMKREKLDRILRRVDLLLDVCEEHQGAHRKIAREVSNEMARELRKDIREWLGK